MRVLTSNGDVIVIQEPQFNKYITTLMDRQNALKYFSQDIESDEGVPSIGNFYDYFTTNIEIMSDIGTKIGSSPDKDIKFGLVPMILDIPNHGADPVGPIFTWEWALPYRKQDRKQVEQVFAETAEKHELYP